MVLKKRKTFENQSNTSTSKFLDWSMNGDEVIPEESKDNNDEHLLPKQSIKRKILVGGIVYHNENDLSVMNNPKKIRSPYPDNGNILQWDENSAKATPNLLSDFRANSLKPKMRKRDPNFSFEKEKELSGIQNVPKKSVKTVKAYLYESIDNPWTTTN
jgi:hypothetical protein